MHYQPCLGTTGKVMNLHYTCVFGLLLWACICSSFGAGLKVRWVAEAMLFFVSPFIFYGCLKISKKFQEKYDAMLFERCKHLLDKNKSVEDRMEACDNTILLAFTPVYHPLLINIFFENDGIVLLKCIQGYKNNDKVPYPSSPPSFSRRRYTSDMRTYPSHKRTKTKKNSW